MAGEEDQQQQMVKRRGSLGRAFERVRTAMKRSSTSRRAVPTLQTASEDTQGTTPAATAASGSATTEPARPSEGAVDVPEEAAPAGPSNDSLLEPDDDASQAADGWEVTLKPLWTSYMELHGDKTRALFQRYGVTYQPVAPTEADSPTKARRIERPVRMRVHWTCHECSREFGCDKTCVGCGHRRCQTCTRFPPKKITAERTEGEQQAAKTPVLGAAAGKENEAPVGAQVPVAKDAIELDPDEAQDTRPSAIEARPRAGFSVVHRPRRSGEPAEPFVPTMVASVQRVYRKPRQRVRFTCDKCESLFTDGARCKSCDHRRCENCTREPAKRTTAPHDPAVVQAVNDRLAAWQRERDLAADETLSPDTS